MTKSNFYPIYIAIIVALGGFLLGFDGIVNSGAIPFYQMTLELYDNSILIGLSTSAIILGGIVGNLVAGPLSDVMGRKKGLILTSLFFALGALGTALAPNIIIFIIFKIVCGLGVGIAILVAPIYIAEIAPPSQRGKLVSINQLNIVIGMSVATISNYYIFQWVDDPNMNWRWMLGVGVIPAILYFALLPFIPESPRWLIQRGRDEEGKAIMRKAGGDAHAEMEFVKIKESISQQHTHKKARFSQIGEELTELFNKRMLWILGIALALAVFQQTSGINAILYYATMIFQSAGVGTEHALFQTVVITLVFVVTTVIAMFLIDILGRKTLLIIGVSLMAISLGLSALFFGMANYQLDGEGISGVYDKVVESAIKTEATNENPENHKFDNIQIVESTAKIIRDEEVIAEVNMSSDTMQSAKNEAEVLRRVLAEIEEEPFNSEVAFFNKIKFSLKKQIQNTIIAAQEEELTPTMAYFSNINEQAVDGSLADINVDELAESITSAKYSQYKLDILNAAISINAVAVLFAILGFLAGFSISLGPVTWTMLSEIFPNKLRGIGISVFGAINGMTSFTVAFTFPSLLEHLGSSITYIVYGASMVMCLLIVLKYVPETKGKSLEELEAILIKD